MNKYNKHQIIASICVSLFVISMAMVILVLGVNKIIYAWCVKDYEAEAVIPDRVDSETLNTETDGSGNSNGAMMSGVEAKLYYNQLADKFASFWGKEYELPGYEISSENTEKLNNIKRYYRTAWVVVLISLIFGIRSFVFLSKRRLYMPFLYGGVFAALLTSVNAFILMRSKGIVLSGIRDMIFLGNYGYFGDGDILKSLLPPEIARWLAFGYIALVFLLILVMVFIRWLIIFSGRPHRF